MKRLFLVLSLVALSGSLAFAQAAAKGGQFGIQTALGVTSSPVLAAPGSIGAKYMITENIAVRAEFGLASQSSGGATTTGYEFGAGFEYHFGGKGGVSPYAGAQIGFGGGALPAGATAPNDFRLKGVFGGEYFFSTNFSLAGELQFGFSSANAAGATTTTLFTDEGLLIGTWYIN